MRLRYAFNGGLSLAEVRSALKTKTLEELSEIQSQIFVFQDGALVPVEASDEQSLTAALIIDCPANEQFRYLKPKTVVNPLQQLQCTHFSAFQQQQPEFTMHQKCVDCSLTKNLWMCLECGRFSCGRKNWDGTGGNGHALQHYEKTGHSIVLKVTSCCKGVQEVYCYKCDNEVPASDAVRERLRELLQLFKLEFILDRGTATELSLDDQVDKNQIKTN